jgi:hypothetical protein
MTDQPFLTSHNRSGFVPAKTDARFVKKTFTSTPDFKKGTKYFVYCGGLAANISNEPSNQITFQIEEHHSDAAEAYYKQLKNNAQMQVQVESKDRGFSEQEISRLKRTAVDNVYKTPPLTVITVQDLDVALFSKVGYIHESYTIFQLKAQKTINPTSTYRLECGKFISTDHGKYVFENGTVKYDPFVPEIHQYDEEITSDDVKPDDVKPVKSSFLSRMSPFGGRGTKSIKKTKRREKTRRRRKKKNSRRSR